MDCVKARAFSLKIQDTCKLFLIVVEDYLRFTYWAELYQPETNYTCFEIFKDYYDGNYFIDRSKLFKLEEELWMDYSKNIIMFEDNCNDILNLDSYGFNCNYFMDYEMDLDLNFENVGDFKPYNSGVINNINNHEMIETIAKNDAYNNLTANMNSFCISSPEKSPKKFSISKDKPKPQKKPSSMVKDFVIKFTKRENVDKKILRKFRKFLKETYKKGQLPETTDFWISFLHENLLPPVNYKSPENGETLTFKSFNTTYMMWLFSHEGGVELYNIFALQKSDDMFELFKGLCGGSQQNENEMDNYIINMAKIYSYKDIKKDDDSLNVYPQNSSSDGSQKNSIDLFKAGSNNVHDINLNVDK
jgi:hypothetical protein